MIRCEAKKKKEDEFQAECSIEGTTQEIFAEYVAISRTIYEEMFKGMFEGANETFAATIMEKLASAYTLKDAELFSERISFLAGLYESLKKDQ